MHGQEIRLIFLVGNIKDSFIRNEVTKNRGK